MSALTRICSPEHPVVEKRDVRSLSRTGLLCILLALSGCATIPEELSRGGPYADTTPLEAQKGGHDGESVRWGGALIKATPLPERTCFEMMAQPLDSRATPFRNDQSLGRFIACAEGFYDPAIFTAGRSVTFTGRIEGAQRHKVGEYEYAFPRLNADAVYLWPKQPDVVYVPYYNPLWDPYWPYYYHPHRHLR